MDIKRTTFKCENEYITMVQGDTLSFGMELYDEDGNAFDTDLDYAYFTCKQNYTDNENVFQKSLDNGITKIDDGKYTVRVAPNDTKNVPAERYFYDLKIGVNSDVFTVLKGVLEIDQDVTKEV